MHEIKYVKSLFDRAICPWFLASTTTTIGMKLPSFFLFLSLSLSLSLLLSPPRGKARHSTSPWSVWNYRKFSIYLSPSCVYVYVYIRLFICIVLRIPYVFACMFVCLCICCMLLSVYNTFTIITIRCSSSTVHLNSRMYTFIFIIFIYIIRKKV